MSSLHCTQTKHHYENGSTFKFEPIASFFCLVNRMLFFQMQIYLVSPTYKVPAAMTGASAVLCLETCLSLSIITGRFQDSFSVFYYAVAFQEQGAGWYWWKGSNLADACLPLKPKSLLVTARTLIEGGSSTSIHFT
jgi:hypothetical protein